MEALETLLIYTKNLILYPDEKKYRKIKISNIHYQERLGHLRGASEAMAAIGYMAVGDYLRLDEQRVAAGPARDANTARLRDIEQFVIDRLGSIKRAWGTLPNRLMNDHQYESVQGAACYSSIGKRGTMEDDEIIVDHFCGSRSQGYFGLYDGHGGRATVDFVVKALHMNLEQQLRRNPTEALAQAFRQAYLATDGQLRRQNILRSGTTSVTCVIRTDDSIPSPSSSSSSSAAGDTSTNGNKPIKKTLFTANVGDSRAVLCRAGNAIRLTIDHKASLPEEAKRITDAGGFIGRNKRVNGVLAISRALGDHLLKENDIVSAEPYVHSTELQSDDSYIILACDGVWDVMTDQEAVEFVNDKLTYYHQKLAEFRTTHPDFVFPPISAEVQAAAAGLGAAGGGGAIGVMSDGDGEYGEGGGSGLGAAAKMVIGTGKADDDITIPRNVNEVLYLTSKDLVKEALDRRSLDNVTVMIVKL